MPLSASRGDRQQQILAALEALGGSGELQEIYQWMERHCDLSARDLGESRYGGTPNYQHAVRSTLSIMKRKRQVIHLNRGVYRLA